MRSPRPSWNYLEARYGRQSPRPDLTQLTLKLRIDKATKAHDQREAIANGLMVASQICMYVVGAIVIIYVAAVIAATIHAMELM